MQRLGRELMAPDELITMDGNKCIMQLRGLRAFLSPKYDLKKHPNYKYTAEADKQNAFEPDRPHHHPAQDAGAGGALRGVRGGRGGHRRGRGHPQL